MKRETSLRSVLLRSLIVCLTITVLLPFQAAAAPAHEWSSRNYPETGQDVAGPFLNYFDKYGGLAQFGYPLTPVRWEGNYQVQYFERQRFEYHPDKAGTDYEVQLGRLGVLLTTDAGRTFPAGTVRASDATNRYFDATGHNLAGRFLAYWQAEGGVTLYGLPISEEFGEISASDGKEYKVQYFERARFEYHPENGAPYDVLLGRLGYDYLLKVEGKAPAAPVAATAPASARKDAAAATPTPATATTLPTGFQGGINLTGWWSGAYNSGDGSAAVEQLAKSGVGYVGLLTTWYQSGAGDTNIAPDPQRTPSDDSLRWAIRTAHGRGLKVSLKPHVDSYDNEWRGHFKPVSLDTWFASYQKMILHYAQLAAQEKVEQLVVGTEFYTINTSSDTGPYWRPIIAQIRAIYGGTLTYGANWAKQNAEYAAITWWDALDYIGIDGYFPLSTKASPSLEELMAGWTSYTDSYGQTYNWFADIAATQAKWGKPVLFVEIGYFSSPTGAAVYDMQQANWSDTALQSRAYDAMFRVFSATSWWNGVYPWNWEIGANMGGANDYGMMLNNKPAMNVIGSWYQQLAKR